MKSANHRYKGKKACIILVLSVAAAMIMEMAGCMSMTHPSGPDLSLGQADVQSRIPATETGRPFPTFKETGDTLCTDDLGRPLILLFSASSCPHCQWVGGVFDLVARQYADKGLVAAHHYDIETGDDLLTETVETRVPESYLSIGRKGDPDGFLPYFNFGCIYDRIGTGYEAQDDLAAEANEMCRVIEALLP